MKPVIVLSPKFLLTLQQQVAGLLHSELTLLQNVEFDTADLLACGWTVELVDQLKAVLEKMREKLVAGSLRVLEDEAGKD